MLRQLTDTCTHSTTSGEYVVDNQLQASLTLLYLQKPVRFNSVLLDVCVFSGVLVCSETVSDIAPEEIFFPFDNGV